jgi:hypothetical protein
MLKRMLLLAVVILCNTLVYGQKKERIKGDRNVTSRETPINSFNKIVVGENFNVDIIVGSQASVFVETDDNLHDIIKFNVADSTLSFQTSKKITSSKKLNIKVVYTNTLKHIETIEGGEISSLTSINLDNVELKNSGTSRVFLNIKSKNLKLTASNRTRVKLNLTSSLANIVLSENSKLDMLINADSLQLDSYQQSDAKIRGGLQKLNIRADNSSNIVGKELTTKTCDILCEGSSDVAVQVTDSLFIDLSGSGEVYLYANPKITINKFADTAKLHKKEL